MRLIVQDDEVTFNVFNALKYHAASDYCFRMYMIEAIVSTQVDHYDPLETSLIQEDPQNQTRLIQDDQQNQMMQKYKSVLHG